VGGKKMTSKFIEKKFVYFFGKGEPSMYFDPSFEKYLEGVIDSLNFQVKMVLSYQSKAERTKQALGIDVKKPILIITWKKIAEGELGLYDLRSMLLQNLDFTEVTKTNSNSKDRAKIDAILGWDPGP
jgi:hypothetical protein